MTWSPFFKTSIKYISIKFTINYISLTRGLYNLWFSPVTFLYFHQSFYELILNNLLYNQEPY